MSLSVIIPSRTISNLIPCVKAIHELDPYVKVIIVDDGVGQPPAPTAKPFASKWVVGQKPFIFSRAINQGIRAAGDDVILLNDDALLKTPGGFTAMQRAAQGNPEYGIISATTNVAGNVEQYPQGIGLREASNAVAFVCVFIPRTTIEKVGVLDERFTAYGFDDTDYDRRVRNAGLKVGIFDGCFVDHASLKSTYRGDPLAPGDCEAGAEIYRQKWG